MRDWLYRRRGVAAFLLTFVLAVSVGLGVTIATENWRLNRERIRAESLAEIEAGRIAHVIDHQLSLTETLRALLVEGRGIIPDFAWLMPDIVDNFKVRNVTLAPGGVVTQVYPLEGNESALGHNLLEDPDRVLEAAIAMNSHRLTLSGPYELLQGGEGLVGRLPVYLTDETEAEYFWGFVCVTIDIPNGLEQAKLSKLEEQGYAYELWRISPDTEEKQLILRSEAPLNGAPEDEAITLPNASWTLSLTPKGGWRQMDVFVFKLVLTLLFALLCALLTKSIRDLAVSRSELRNTLRQQSKNYSYMNRMNEDLRSFRHDIHNHMLSLSTLLERGDLDGAQEYIGAISQSLDDSVRIVNTENYVFDALLAQKLHEARLKGIQTEQEIILGNRLKIENRDWSTLFGNALDNAIEACASSVRPPKIRVSVRCRGNTLYVSITNTAPLPPKVEDGIIVTGKEDPQDHGMGLKQMKAIVKKYHGALETGWSDGIFTLTFLLTDV